MISKRTSCCRELQGDLPDVAVSSRRRCDGRRRRCHCRDGRRRGGGRRDGCRRDGRRYRRRDGRHWRDGCRCAANCRAPRARKGLFARLRASEIGNQAFGYRLPPSLGKGLKKDLPRLRAGGPGNHGSRAS